MVGEKKYITAEELKKHNMPGDLWISIQGWSTTSLIGLRIILFSTGFYLKDFQVSDVSKDYRRLASEFSKLGLFDKKGHGVMYSLISVAIMLSLVFYGVLKSESVLVHMGCAVLLGLLWMQSAYVGHDSGHYQIMPTRGITKFTQLIAGNCLTGISIAWWKWTHNAHHISCNSLDYDPDLQHIPVFAVSSRFFTSLTSCFYGRKLTFDRLARFSSVISMSHFILL
ncbi:hypothetical protein FNV43_RR01189 [Rhamnella rubrinervis]|uniref:Fatty acid desaturase domain-containing protein n=1 Tax=Rhamnella rubrinervis TaxID=2594499 RepID=A0A8K0HPY4_9ROSA|nr:hypothetical protein FNV43_RR01189 [Rhamnella rubrinervis]